MLNRDKKKRKRKKKHLLERSPGFFVASPFHDRAILDLQDHQIEYTLATIPDRSLEDFYKINLQPMGS